MKENVFEIVTKTLLSEEKYKAEDGTLLKARVYSDVMTLDAALIKLLVENERIRKTFFIDIDGVLVFDKQQFAWLIELKEFLPDSFTSYTNKIGLAAGRKFISTSNDVVLDFPYKDCVLQGGQDKDDQKRQEIMFNETLASDEIRNMLAPKVFTNAKRYTAVGQKDLTGELITDTIKIEEETGVEFKDTDNLIIKGNNLIALSSLLTKYEEQVKLIYIDPPYNTGSDSFSYNDNFNHSTWLTFMKNRLKLAKKLLRPDGIIFISINHMELGYLLVLMDEIFGNNNKLPIVTLRVGTTASFRSINDCPVNVSEYVISYSKTAQYMPNTLYVASSYSEDYSHYIVNYKEPPEKWVLESISKKVHNDASCSTWQEYKKKKGSNWKEIRYQAMSNFALENAERVVSLNTMQKPSSEIKKLIHNSKNVRNKVFTLERENASPIFAYNGRTLAFFKKKLRIIDGNEIPSEVLTNLWTDISFLGIGPEGNVTLENGKKPEKLLKTIIELACEENDIVLDFHLGSGTTAAVAQKMNRRYIGIEQLNQHISLCISRLTNVLRGDQSGISEDMYWQGGGSFVYCELKENARTLIDAIQKATDGNISIIKTEIYNDKRIVPYLTREELLEVDKDFESLSLKDKKKALIKLVDKNKLYINYSDIDDEGFNISEEDKKFSRSFYEVD